MSKDPAPSEPVVPDSSDQAEDFKDLFEQAPCGYLSLEPNGRILRANATFAAWVGYSRDELKGRRFHDLLNVAGRVYYETHFAPLLRMQGHFNEVALEFATRSKDRLPVLVNAAERRDERGDLLFIRITVFNAVDRRRYEQELLDAQRKARAASEALQELNARLEDRVAEEVAQRMKTEEALRQSQKMEIVGQLTGGVAHDFNNLLTVIVGGLDTIGRQLDRPLDEMDLARMRRSRDMAHHGAQRAATLTARLLAFSRQQTLAPQKLEPNRLISGVADLLQRTLGETIAFETVSAGGLWQAFADPGELENALINLAVNARDAMPEGGRLTIETANTSLDEAYVAALTEPVKPGQYVLIAVSDTGSGMSAETISRVFEPFFTTKEVGKGTGLGLSQVYGFIRQSGGHVRIYSELGQGTTVKLYLPRATNADVDADPKLTGECRADGGSETVMVVEDHDDLRAYCVGVLQELGYRVLEASNGRSALEILQTDTDVALLFTDVVLPDGLDGRELASEAKRRRPGLRVLFTTGYTRNAVIHNGRLEPGVQMIGKPFTFAELAARIRSILDSIPS
ncbi:PAS domain-containing hybrid sensor histidine kinase/response regulator [Rhizobium leguminosarum]|uniref:histidine kinase n=1 Tax=Rhizobium leguminosarum TaxID=384 RepID=A0A7K3VNU4_RHILE|nr:PAS domain-containing hybrid sensor histidine kinase/response regulator [Rhizobium leguminosarum]NEK18397.1 response regulator [Rhizobium leguminosarum]NEK37390.1 response regulator [Rhizobium leguminosarum]